MQYSRRERDHPGHPVATRQRARLEVHRDVPERDMPRQDERAGHAQQRHQPRSGAQERPREPGAEQEEEHRARQAAHEGQPHRPLEHGGEAAPVAGEAERHDDGEDREAGQQQRRETGQRVAGPPDRDHHAEGEAQPLHQPREPEGEALAVERLPATLHRRLDVRRARGAATHDVDCDAAARKVRVHGDPVEACLDASTAVRLHAITRHDAGLGGGRVGGHAHHQHTGLVEGDVQSRGAALEQVGVEQNGEVEDEGADDRVDPGGGSRARAAAGSTSFRQGPPASGAAPGRGAANHTGLCGRTVGRLQAAITCRRTST